MALKDSTAAFVDRECFWCFWFQNQKMLSNAGGTRVNPVQRSLARGGRKVAAKKPYLQYRNKAKQLFTKTWEPGSRKMSAKALDWWVKNWNIFLWQKTLFLLKCSNSATVKHVWDCISAKEVGDLVSTYGKFLSIMPYHQGGIWLAPDLFCSRRMTTNIQPVSLRTFFYEKKNKKSWKWWCGSHRALFSTSWSQSEIKWQGRRIWESLNPQRICDKFSKMFGTTYQQSFFKNCVQVFLEDSMLFEMMPTKSTQFLKKN